jgi:pantetheine-phosphate adenylyltransferase
MKNAIYAGSFDVIHNGHISIIERALELFPTRQVVVIVANNRDKKHYFSIDERMEIVNASLKHLKNKNIKIIAYEGIISEWANKNNADIMIRGLRDGNDLTYEFSLEQFTRASSNLETIYLSPFTEHLNTSSSLIRMFLQTNNIDKAKNFMNEKGFETMVKILNRGKANEV